LTADLRLEHTAHESRLVIEGELDLATASVLQRALLSLEREAGQRLMVLDLRNVHFIDAASTRAVVDAHARSVQARRDATVLLPYGRARRLLEYLAPELLQADPQAADHGQS
jgi:anti-anti-sigma factor